ncbi:hypothetical protein [Streptomyces sp. enrichment culture]|uniref:hypothetical protein n=1 Tax=Streptomyces sp. enrichment culture TaxID=1795815 RepID=UPI003F560E90
MLENWYFCSALSLPPRAASDYLDVVTALREPVEQPGSGELVCAALEWLAGSDTPLAVYALPHVLRAHQVFLAEHERYETEDAPAEHRRCVCVRELTGRTGVLYRSVAEVLPQELRPLVTAVLQAVGTGDPEAVRLLGKVLDGPAVVAAATADEPSPPYHDLLDHLLPSVLLAAARALTGVRRDALGELLDEFPVLLDGALRGRYGRLALLQATELAAALRPEDTTALIDRLARAVGGSFDMEPDVLATAARVVFRSTGETDDDVWDRLVTEAATGAELGRWTARRRPTGVPGDGTPDGSRRVLAYARLGGTGNHRYSPMPGVLWQAALYERAAELDAGRAARWLERYWQAPDGLPPQRQMRVTVPHGDDYAHAQLHVGRLLRLRGHDGRLPVLYLTDGPAEATDPATAAQVWSPWILSPPGEPKQFRATPEQMVRLLAAGSLAVRLLSARSPREARGTGRVPDFLLLLLTHVRDILGTRHRTLMKELTDGHGDGSTGQGQREAGAPRSPAVLSAPVRRLGAFMLHQIQQVDAVGTGKRPGVHPGEVVRLVAGVHAWDTQERKPPAPVRSLVRSRTALGIGLSWLQEAAAGGTRPHRTEGSGRWFTTPDGTVAPARALLEFASGLGDQPHRSTSVQAALLWREIYPGESAYALRWDWVGGRPEYADPSAAAALHYRRLLLSAPKDPGRDAFSVADWAGMGEELERDVSDDYGIIPVTVRTLRLTALLREPDLGDAEAYGDWVTSWSLLVRSLNLPQHLPRWVRGRMFDMFASPVSGKGSHDRVLRVLEQVVDTVIDLSSKAPFYYDRLFEVLGDGMHLAPTSANRLRQRALRSLYVRWGPWGLTTSAGNPFDVCGDRASLRGTEAALVEFLRNTSHRMLEARELPLATGMNKLWRDAHAPALTPAQRVEPGASDGESWLVRAGTVDRRAGETILYQPGVVIDARMEGRNRVPVHNLFLPDAPRPEEGMYVLGLVTAKDGSTTGSRQKLWINFGQRFPVPALVPEYLARRRRVGDAVAVLLTADGARLHGDRVVALARRPPEDGEIRTAELSVVDRFPGLELSVHGVDEDGYPRGTHPNDIAARRRWDPDLSRTHSSSAGTGLPCDTLARWDKTLGHWVPVDAGPPELAVAPGVDEADTGQRSERTTLRLVLEGPATDRTGFGPAWRFVTTPGRAYVLGPSAWDAADWQKLDEACSAGRAGLIVHASYEPGHGRLTLREPAPGQSPFDDRNARWLELFDASPAQAPSSGPAEDEHDDDQTDIPVQELYLEAQRHDADGDGGSWTIDVPAVAGFPTRIKVNLIGRVRRKRALCSIDHWGEPQARGRLAVARAMDESGVREKERSPEAYDRLARLREGMVVELVRQLTRKPEDTDCLVMLSSGLTGWAATESLTLTGEFPVISETTRRRAIVVQDNHAPRPQPQRVPDAYDDLGQACTGLTDPARLERTAALPGLVLGRMYNTDNALTMLRVWLRLDDEVIEAVVPALCFDQASPSVGDHLTAVRTPDGWVFSILRRRLRLRALWEWADDLPDNTWHTVGVVSDRGENYGNTVSQHPSLARLALSRALEAGRQQPERARARRLHRGRVLVELDGRSLVGTMSGFYLDATAQPVHVDQVLVHTLSVDTTPASRRQGDRPRYTDVQRRFVLSPATLRSRPDRNRRTADPAVEWARFLARRDRTLEGPKVRGRLHLDVLAPDANGTYQTWLDPDDGPQTFVGGRGYSEHLVRAAPVPYGRGYRYSHLRAAPLTVAEFVEKVAPRARTDGSRCPIEHDRRPYYVGFEETDAGPMHRFEWGYGWFADVPHAALTVGGAPVDPAALTLFHGDRIDAVSLTAAAEEEVPGGLRVSIALRDIRKSVEYQIHQEAAHDVVHLLDLEIDHATGRVAVLRVYTRSRGVDRHGADDHVEGRSVRALLHPDDVARLLAAVPRDTSRQRVLGRATVGEGPARGRVHHFRLVPPKAAPDDQTPGLRAGDRLYMEAGRIQPTANDYLLRFDLPPGVVEPGAPDAAPDRAPFHVIVTRRYFSHREGVLRRAAETDGLGAYEGQAKMLVELLRPSPDKENRWQGSTKSPLPRPLDVLRSYLNSRSGGCFGVVDPAGQCVEVRPGVVFPMADLHRGPGITPRSVVRLDLADTGLVNVVLAIPADDAYLSDRPRPVVVFPKDNLKTKDDLRRADEPGRFTLAGLPGISATSRKGFGKVLLQTRHPRIAAVRREEQPRGGPMDRVVPLDHSEAGTLAFDPSDVVGGVRRERLAPAGTELATAQAPMAWAQLSFMDDSAQRIAQACARHGWTYHDSRTREWVPGEDKPRTRRLPARARSINEPVFFSRNSAGWTLRHESEALQRFGFPATELLEEPTDDIAEGRRRSWAVAHANRRSVWLELAPGRVSEVRRELVRFADGHSLADLDWSLFSPGDLVYGRVEGGVNECGHLVLDDWRPGLRGAMAASSARRMLLPVALRDEEAGALYLGEGRGTMLYPADQTVLDAHQVESAVWLDRANRLSAAEPGSVAVNDVVFLALDREHGLRVCGLPRARVELAAESDTDAWFGCGWLRTELMRARQGGAGLLNQLDVLPVTVEQVVTGPETVVTVSRRAQPRSIWPQGTVLVQPVADLGRGNVAVRSGSALFRVHIRQLVPGLPEHGTPIQAASRALVGTREYVRLHWNKAEKLLSCGIPGRREADGAGGGEEIVVRPWLRVNNEEDRVLGVVCRDIRTQRPHWLPVGEAAWTGGLRGATLFDHLRGIRRLTVLRDGPGTVSLSRLPLVEREFHNLTPGRLLPVRVVTRSPAETSSGETASCLVSVEPLGVLAAYSPADVHAELAEESLVAEVARVRRDRRGGRFVTLVKPGSRHTVMDLPRWTSEALVKLRLPDFRQAPRPVADLVPARFAAYWRSYEEGQAGKLTAEAAESEACQVMRARGLLLSADGADRAEVQGFAVRAVTGWLGSIEGQAVLHHDRRSVDLAPALAACAIGSLAVKKSWPVRPSLPDDWPVFLLQKIGLRALGSLHTEALVTQWLTRQDRQQESGGLWRRLRSIELGPELTDAQMESLERFAQALTGLATADGDSHPAAPVARGLVAACGGLPDADALLNDAVILRPLADLGRSLRPAADAAAAQRFLLDRQVSVLNTALLKITRNKVPLTLLPPLYPPTAMSQKYALSLRSALRNEAGPPA